MRAILVVGVLVALSLVKIHLVRAEGGERQTRIALQQPFSMPVDSADAYCLRRLDQPIVQCAAAFADQRDSAIRLVTLSFCRACAQIGRWMSTIGRDKQQIEQRERDYEAIAGMAFDKS